MKPRKIRVKRIERKKKRRKTNRQTNRQTDKQKLCFLELFTRLQQVTKIDLNVSNINRRHLLKVSRPWEIYQWFFYRAFQIT